MGHQESLTEKSNSIYIIMENKELSLPLRFATRGKFHLELELRCREVSML